MKLGAKLAPAKPERLRAGIEILAHLPPAPAAVDWSNGVTNWGMMKNDQYGDCTCAGIAHNVQVASLNGYGRMETAPDAEVLKLYSAATGFNPGDPTTDQGAYLADIITFVERNGFFGNKLLGHVSIDPHRIDSVRQAVAHFGCLYFGAQLPRNYSSQKVWDVAANDGGIVGGHCMVVPRYDVSKRTFSFITWGANQRATFEWWEKYVFEAHVLLWDDWLQRYPPNTQDAVIRILRSLN
jgi:hypothetical protein